MDSKGDRAVRVLQSVVAPSETRRYIDQITFDLPSSIELLWFSWHAALIEQYDVFHIHWPEQLLNSESFLGRCRKRILTVGLITRLKLRRIPVVRSLHNVRPHGETSWTDRLILRWLATCETNLITLNPIVPEAKGRSVEMILHGDYRRAFEAIPVAERVPGQLLYFGTIRAYKGLPELVSAFGEVDSRGLSLRIVGEDREGIGQREYQRAIDRRLAVSAKFGHVSDSEMVHEITQSVVVVLPYREMHNSGVALVALSLSRPILLPASEAADHLANEVGTKWVRTYSGTLTASDLERAVAAGHALSPSDVPRLEGRDWVKVSRAHASLYFAVVGATERM